MNWREELREQQARTAAWMKAQEGRLQHTAAQLEAKGREVYAQAIKTGQKVVARTPAELKALGLAAVQGRLPQAVGQVVVKEVAKHVSPPRSGQPSRATPKPGASPGKANPLVREALDQVLAGARGAQDALTLGAGDHIYAGARAVADSLNGKDLVEAYKGRIATERARDEYDAQHYKTARMAGQVAGTAAGLVALGPADALVAGGVRMAEAAPLVLREIGALGGVGGLGGVASQAVEDFQRQKLGTVGDYAGSALGGATTALASTRVGPGQAAAIGGAVTSVAQDKLNGRPVSLEKAGEAALAGGYSAAPFGLGGRNYSEGLHFTEKGKLGDALGAKRARLNGAVPEPGGRHVGLPSGRRTVLDGESNTIPILEYKFGRKAKLSPGQREAYELFGPEDYHAYHFLPRDIGALYGYPMGQLGYHQVLDEPD